MGEENIDITFASEEIEPEVSATMNTSSPLEDPIDIVNEQKNMDCDVATDENKGIYDKTTDVVKEEDAVEIKDMSDKITDIVKEEDEDLTRKNPSAVIVGPDHKFTVRSRYRRASTGSCHDACKYSDTHKREPEKVTKRPHLGTIRENKPLRRTTSGDNLAKFVPEKETKSKGLLRRLSLPGQILEKDPPCHTEVTKVTPTQPKLKRVQTEVKSSSVRTPGSSFGRSKIDIPAVKKTPLEKSSQKHKEIDVKEVGSSTDSKKVKAKETTVNSLRAPLKKSGSIKARLYKDLKSFSRSRHQSTENAEVKKSSDDPEKANTSNTPTEKALKSPPSNETAKKSNVTKKVTRFGLPSFSSPSSSKSTSQPQRKYQPKSDSIKPKQNGGPKMEKGAAKTNAPRAITSGDHKTKAKKTGISRPEEKDGSAWKVKFKRGTVVNLQVANNSPRKLRFKRGRILGEDQNAKDNDRSLKNTDTTDELCDKKPEHEKVQLRRQEGAGKKDSIDLNDVIEETASKLVKTRKSKVKALVGAFETVMSFRDRKPLVETSAS